MLGKLSGTLARLLVVLLFCSAVVTVAQVKGAGAAVVGPCGPAGSVSVGGTYSGEWTGAGGPGLWDGTWGASWVQDGSGMITSGTIVVESVGESDLAGSSCLNLPTPTSPPLILGGFAAGLFTVTQTTSNIWSVQHDGTWNATWANGGASGTFTGSGTLTTLDAGCVVPPSLSAALEKAQKARDNLLAKKQKADQKVAVYQAKVNGAESVIALVTQLRAEGNNWVALLIDAQNNVALDWIKIATAVVKDKGLGKAVDVLGADIASIQSDINLNYFGKARALVKKSLRLSNKVLHLAQGFDAVGAFVEMKADYERFFADVSLALDFAAQLHLVVEQLKPLTGPYKNATTNLEQLHEKLDVAQQEAAGLAIRLSDAEVAVGVAEQAIADACS